MTPTVIQSCPTVDVLTSEIPSNVCAYITGAVVSLATIAMSSVQTVAQILDPTKAESWSVYGILICAVIFLAVCILYILKWIATTWMTKQQVLHDETKTQNEETRKVLTSLAGLIERQVDFFESTAKDHLRGKAKTAEK